MRVFGRPGSRTPSPEVASWLAREQAAGLGEAATYDAFRERVGRNREALVWLLKERRAAGRRIAGYGAPAKAATLLGYCGIGPELLDFVADRSPLKHGRTVPGTRVPIVPVERIEESRPDDLLVLAWNLLDEIVEQQSAHRRRGGAFIVPIPEPRVLATPGPGREP
jgi:hypothetical protein